MKNFIIVVLAIIVVVLLIGSSGAYTLLHDITDKESAIEEAADKASNVVSSGSNSDVVSEEVKFNGQNGEGYYREVTYKDGGFRQYDRDTGELIGSSYSSDQDKLPSIE